MQSVCTQTTCKNIKKNGYNHIPILVFWWDITQRISIKYKYRANTKLYI